MRDATATFREALPWRPEPEIDADDDAPPSATEMAVALLRQIAEDQLLRGSHRAAARRYLRRLREG